MAIPPRAYLCTDVCMHIDTFALSSPLPTWLENGCPEHGLVGLMRARWCLMSEMCCCSVPCG